MSIKLLVIRFSSIGDIVLTSPVVRCIGEQLMDIEIHFLTKKRFAMLSESNPYITKVYSFERSLSEVLPALKKEKYTHIIDLHRNLRTSMVLINLLRPFKAFNKLNVEKWMMVKFKVNRLPAVHIVDRYMATVKDLGVVNDGKGLDFFIPENEKVQLVDDLSVLIDGYVGFVIGGNHNTKIFPADMVADVCRALNLPVVLLGGKEDFARGEQIIELSGGKALNFCGKFNLMQSASLVQQSTAIISNDTGLMHIAAAFHKPIVSVWGNTVTEFGMYPYVPSGVEGMIAEVKNLGCRPCSKLGYQECPLKHFNCMRYQDTKAIAGFVNRIVKQN